MMYHIGECILSDEIIVNHLHGYSRLQNNDIITNINENNANNSVDNAADIDAEYKSSREYMGASVAPIQCGTAARLDRDTTIGDKTMNELYASADIEVINLLYEDVMGLSRPPPALDNCVYTNVVGYSYKEPCHDDHDSHN